MFHFHSNKQKKQAANKPFDQINSSSTNGNGTEPEEEDDGELERLRIEALNAKKAKLAAQTQNADIFPQSIKKPGRFRYDKESEEEEEDEDDDLNYNYSNNYDEEDEDEPEHEQSQEEEPANVNNQDEYVPSNTNSYFNNNEAHNNSYQSNYQTYRFECSKIMSSSDAYEPAFNFERNNNKSTITNNFDLRNFLRSKQQQQQDVSQTVNYQYQIEYDQAEQQQQYTNEQTNRIVTNLEDLDYSEPITQPISIDTKYGYNRYRSNSNGYKRKFNERCRYFSSDVDGSREYLNGSMVNLANVDGENGQNGENKCDRDGENNGFSNNEEYQAQNDDPGEEDTDDEEEEDLRRKKIRSVVVAKVIVPNEKCKFFFFKCRSNSHFLSCWS